MISVNVRFIEVNSTKKSFIGTLFEELFIQDFYFIQGLDRFYCICRCKLTTIKMWPQRLSTMTWLSFLSPRGEWGYERFLSILICLALVWLPLPMCCILAVSFPLALRNIYIILYIYICNVYINVIIFHAILGPRVHCLLMWLLFSCYLRTQSTWFISSKSKVRICFGACLYCFYGVLLAISYLQVIASNYLQNMHRWQLVQIIFKISEGAWF